jgi:hypothetical protein
MKAREGIFAFALIVLVGTASLAAGDRIGETAYLEGDVSVMRNGDELSPSDVQVGMGIENFDLLSTGADGLAEVRMTSPKAASMTVKLSANTKFSFELSRIGSKQQSSVNLITGSLSLKVSKLTGAQDVKVRTESTAMGVRGTQFTVTAPPSGDILVTCDEGEVVCTDEDGRNISAAPGTAIEKQEGEALRKVPIAVSDLETFRANWLAERIEALKANALQAITNYAKLYDSMTMQFLLDYGALMKNKAVLNKWVQEDKKGQVGGRLEVMKEKKEIIGLLFKLRKTLFRFERVYYRLLELKAYHDQGYGKGFIRTGVTTDDFFAGMEKDKKDLERAMATVRYVAKLYALRNNGTVPTGAFDEPQGGSDDFFKDSGP